MTLPANNVWGKTQNQVGRFGGTAVRNPVPP